MTTPPTLEQLPDVIAPGESFRLDTNHHEPYSHYLFRFPSKFHPPLVRSLIERYSRTGDVVLDPAVGSGTALIECLVLGRSAIGLDVDPLSCFLSRVKTTALDPDALSRHWAELQSRLAPLERPRWRYERMKFPSADLSDRTFRSQTRDLQIPRIPNALHWFRRYVLVDLALIRQAIATLNAPAVYKDFFDACFAAIIRRASNADPIPVSGLEVTRHIRELDAQGRLINPFDLFRTKVSGEIPRSELFSRSVSASVTSKVIEASALDLPQVAADLRFEPVDLVLTSPPYGNAIEYHRRHKLEMYWLGLVGSQDDLVSLSHRYIGRRWGHETFPVIPNSQSLTRTLAAVSKVSPHKVRPLASYFSEIDRFLISLRSALKRKGRCIVVIGDSRTKNLLIPTHRIVRELGEQHMDLELWFSYEIRNRYMQYFRHNGANIKRDHVLVFRRR